ncbi:Crp/Fnr family transcriptional regulator [Calderihabitans maritimus]|uniref:CarD family transcriptional regulator n=1 Tax=Calderihabitans maritimus TaxID=1246530 RepID=A0A1Z5HN57_9FIRM|nr:Crp/Fnr family transcriptional regulator [Calderihabitans maritimus]GAW90962.1 CarD family transcriptional regulator [Calderihabitans maritimus]
MTRKVKCMKDLEIFEPLSEEEKEQVTKLARAVSFRKGEIIFAEGDPADTIYLIRAGKVLLYKISEEGKEISLDILQQDDIFGENTIFDNVQHTMHAKALEDTFVCTCSRNDFLHLIKNPMTAFKIIKALGEKLNNYTEQMASMAFRDVKGRVLDTLVRLAREYGKDTPKGIKIDISLNHQDLANLVNASRVMVTNTLNVLKQEGKIAVYQRRFYLLNQPPEKEVVRHV